MLTILLRTVIVYILLIGTMRLMGKRQLGELEISELVTTLLLSEIASIPIEDPHTPVIVVIIPVVTILTLEIALSLILLKCPRLKGLASARPSVLIRHGEIDQAELLKARISTDELISEVRQAGLGSPEDVDYAILEQNGKISVIPRRAAQPPNASDLDMSLEEGGILHILISDGRMNERNMQLLKVTPEEISGLLEQKGFLLREVFLLGMDDAENLYWVKKEEAT